MSLRNIDGGQIVQVVWHLIAPNNKGEGGHPGGVSERAVLVSLADRFPEEFSNGTPGARDVRAIHERLVALKEGGRLIEYPGGGWRTPMAPEDALYTLAMKGEKHVYSFRGSREHAAKETCATLSDLTGWRADFLEAVFVAHLSIGGHHTLKAADMSPISFRVERSA